MLNQRKVLIIYTGGTIGMDRRSKDQLPLDDFKSLFPDIDRLPYKVDWEEVNIFSNKSDQLLFAVRDNYPDYDGIVILFGTGWMSDEASSLSYEISGLGKPIIATGSMKQASLKGSDGPRNLLGAIEIAARSGFDLPLIPEVSIYFNGKLMRAVNCRKERGRGFDAFVAPEKDLLAVSTEDSGIRVFSDHILLREKENFCAQTLSKDAIYCFGPESIDPVVDEWDARELTRLVDSFQKKEKKTVIIDLSLEQVNLDEFKRYEVHFGDLPVFYLGEFSPNPNWICLSGLDLRQAVHKVTFMLNLSEDREMLQELSKKSFRGEGSSISTSKEGSELKFQSRKFQ